MSSSIVRAVCAEMKSRRVGQILTAALAIGLAAGLLLPVVFPSLPLLTLDYLEATTRQLGREIAERSGVVFLITFDEPGVREWISGARCLAPGTRVVAARYGRGRELNGRLQAFVETPIRWSRIKGDYTISLWVKPDGQSTTQDILFRSGNAQQTGFRIEEGILKFDVPAPDGNDQTLQCPYGGFGKFSHLAATVSRADGRAALYLNGELQDEIAVRAVAMPEELIEFGKRRWFAARHPIQGIIDETVIWNRALEPEEIGRIFRSRRGALSRLASPGAYLRWRSSSFLAALGRAAGRLGEGILDRTARLFSPSHSGDLPRLELILSGADRRHFASAHRCSLESGRRTDRAANSRDIHFRIGEKTRRGLLQLYGSDTSYPDNLRPAYILEARDGEIRPGISRLLLCPPENVSFLLPLVENELAAEMGIPGVAAGLLDLRLNNLPQGVYYYLDWDRLGVVPGDYPELFRGPKHPKDWKTPFRFSEQPLFYGRLAKWRLPLTGEEVEKVFDRVSRRYRPILLNDPASSLTREERARRLDRDRKRRAEIWPTARSETPAAQRWAGFLSEYLVLGGNPSPDRVTKDLDLAGLQTAGVGVEWSSSRPEIIDQSGRVIRPAGRLPVAVEMTATFSGGTEEAVRNLTFRVMPEQTEVAALMVYARQPVQKVRRVDARIDYYPPGGEREPITLWATQRKRGGISHRGNTSYWKVKKLLSLRTDTPHGIFGESRSRHLQCINSLEDETFIRNRLSYDLFRTFGFGRAEKHYAPRVTWAEIFCNGVYQGLHEVGARVDEVTLDFAEGEPGTGPLPVIYKHETVEPREPYMRQERPNRRRGLFLEPFCDLDKFLTAAPAGEFAESIGERFDLDNAVDFHLLLNLTQNINGYPFDFTCHDILARDGRAGARFFNVPWDFAVSFRSHWQWRWMANGLQKRLEEDLPGYRQRLRKRWSELRRDLLDEDNLVAAINHHAGRIHGYARWDYRRWNYPPEINHPDSVADLITVLKFNLEQVDGHLAGGENEDRPAGGGSRDGLDNLRPLLAP